MPRAIPTPTYEEAMRFLEAHTLPTSGSGNKCLFHALEGEVSRDGRLADEQGNAAALRMRAGALMRDGYARHLSRGDDEEWNAHVRQLLRPRLRHLQRGAGQATVSACAAAMGRDIVRADVFCDAADPGTRGTIVFARFPHGSADMVEITMEEARQTLLGGAIAATHVTGS